MTRQVLVCLLFTSNQQFEFSPERLLLFAWRKVTVSLDTKENTYMLRFGAIRFWGGPLPFPPLFGYSFFRFLGLLLSILNSVLFRFSLCISIIFEIYSTPVLGLSSKIYHHHYRHCCLSSLFLWWAQECGVHYYIASFREFDWSVKSHSHSK